MAILKRVSNRQGDGAGRALYALKHAVAVRTDIPSPLSLVLVGELSPELRKELAREFNRHLLLHQGSSKTQHYVISFGHHLTQKEIEKVLDRLERLFDDPYRYHLFVVHQEEHGTAVHIIESADPEGRLRHLSRKEFFDLKRAIVRELQPFLNEREQEVAKNFSRNIATEDWKHPIELFAPERSFKEYIRQAVRDASELLKSGRLEEAVELLESRGVEVREYKARELSPAGKPLKRDRLYAVFNHPYRGLIAVRLDKKMKATFQLYLNALEELERELGRVEEEFEQVEGALRESEPLRGGASSKRDGVPAEGGGAPKEGAGAPSGDEHLREAEGAPKQGSREFKGEGGRAPRERAGIDEDKRKAGKTKDSKGGVELTVHRTGEEVQRAEKQGRGEKIPSGGTPAESKGARGEIEGRAVEGSPSSIADIFGEFRDERLPLRQQSENQSAVNRRQEQNLSAQPTVKGQQGETFPASTGISREQGESREPSKETQPIQAEISQPSKPSQENFPAQTGGSRPSEPTQPIPAERNNAPSSEELGDTGRRQRETVLSAHSEQLSDFPLHQRRLGIRGQPLRDVHSSKSQSEVEMPISREILDEIKQLPPEKVLSYLGIPYKQVGNQIMALAVWRGEKEASVSIQYKDGKWLWHDFGTGEGGDWIDLYRRYTGSDFKEAVSTLMELSNLPYTPNMSMREPVPSQSRVYGKREFRRAPFEEIIAVLLSELETVPQDLEAYLKHKGFLDYLPELEEIPYLYYLRYRREEKEYSGLAVKTLAGTWVIKNLQGTYLSTRPTDVSFWRGTDNSIVVVESFTDAIAIKLQPKFKNSSVLILNGLPNLKRAVEIIRKLKPEKIYIALDLDERGLKARKELKELFPEAKQVYFYGKDPAEYLSSNDEEVRTIFSPIGEDWIIDSHSLYLNLLAKYMKSNALTEHDLLELSPDLYDHFIESQTLREEIAEAKREIERQITEEPFSEPKEEPDGGWEPSM